MSIAITEMTLVKEVDDLDYWEMYYRIIKMYRAVKNPGIFSDRMFINWLEVLPEVYL